MQPYNWPKESKGMLHVNVKVIIKYQVIIKLKNHYLSQYWGLSLANCGCENPVEPQKNTTASTLERAQFNNTISRNSHYFSKLFEVLKYHIIWQKYEMSYQIKY